MAASHIRRPHAAARPLTAQQVTAAYNYPTGTSGNGRTVAVIELGGKVNASDLQSLGLPQVQVVDVDGAHPAPDDADAEVMLDVEVILQVAPAASVVVYFAPNTDAGFYDAFARAVADLKPGDAISCSWGGPESSWDPATMQRFDALFAAAKANRINVFCASGDSGSKDGTARNVVDFPASSPHAVACGGTRLTVNTDGSRAAEVTWDDNDTSSATGGGDSRQFPGRAVPDVAGNADPQTGYEITVDGQAEIVGGTSAVAPLYAALAVRLAEAAGPFDFQAAVLAHPEVCFDVTAGDNGGFRAGPGRDKTTGFGVVDGSRMLATLATPAPTPVPAPPPAPSQLPADVTAWARIVVTEHWRSKNDRRIAQQILDFTGSQP